MKDLFNSIGNATVTERNVYTGNDGLLYCGKCGSPKQMKLSIPLKGERTVGIMCECEVKEERERERRRVQEENDIKRKICFAETNMNNWTFANSDKSNLQLEKIMQNYAEKFSTFKKDGKGLLLWGDVGTGKTYMAACVANALIDAGYKVYMTNFASLTNKISGMWEGKQEYINSLNHYSLLILDDLGAERKSEYMQEMIFNIVDARYRSGLPMIITTNLTIEEIKKPKDISNSRIYDRILERCHPINISGSSKRRKKIIESFREMESLLGIKKGD